MKVFKEILNFYINSSIHVALAVYCLVRITEFYLGLGYNNSLNYFIFYATITGYNFVKYAGIAKLHHRSLTNNLKIIQIFSFVCFGLTLFYASKLQLKTLVFFVPFGVLTFLYAVPILNGLTKNLRNIPSIKIIVIGLVWSGVTVLLPVFYVGGVVDSNVVLIFVQRFLFVLVLILPFDIRDLKFDNENLKTIPQKIGVKQTKKIGFVLLAFCLLFEFFIAPTVFYKTIFFGVFFVTFFLLMRAKENQSKYYSSFWVEAIPILWFVFLFFSR